MISISELERKPHNEWTEDEIKFWLSEYAKDIMMAEIGWDYGSEN